MLDNFDNLQSSWVTQGGKVGQLSLAYGANDMGSVMIEENVVRAAGAEYCMDEFEVVRNIESAGFLPKRRNMHYDVLGDPVFREREVPRMLELAVARADGKPARPRTCAATQPGARPPDARATSNDLPRAMGAADRPRADRRRLDRNPRRTAASLALAPARPQRRSRISATSRSCPGWSTHTLSRAQLDGGPCAARPVDERLDWHFVERSSRRP